MNNAKVGSEDRPFRFRVNIHVISTPQRELDNAFFAWVHREFVTWNTIGPSSGPVKDNCGRTQRYVPHQFAQTIQTIAENPIHMLKKKIRCFYSQSAYTTRIHPHIVKQLCPRVIIISMNTREDFELIIRSLLHFNE